MTESRSALGPRPLAAIDVCLAEDDDDIRGLVVAILRKAGFEIVQYDNGQSALESIGTEAAALYLLDIRMPRMGGLELCRVLRATPATRESMVLLMSAEASPGDVAAGLAAGADDFLPKPFSRRQLLSRIERLGLQAAGATGHRSSVLSARAGSSLFEGGSARVADHPPAESSADRKGD